MKYRCIVPLLLLSAVLCHLPAGAQDDPAFEQVAKRGIDHVYNLEFEQAEEAFHQLVVRWPDHPGSRFFEAMILWWRIVLDMDNTQYDERFLSMLDEVIDMCDARLDKNPDDVTAIFFKGGSIGFKGRLQFHRGDYIGAANAGRLALPLVQTASQLDPHNYDILLGTGMYNYYADVIPAEYPWLKPLLLFVPPGDKAKGIQQLTLAAERGRYAAVEATYFLLQLYFYYEKDYVQSLALARRLHGRFDANMLFHRYVGRCHASLGDWAETERVFHDVLERCRRGQRGYAAAAEREATYYLGVCAMNRQQFDSALVFLYRCDELSRSLDKKEISGFMVMANLKIGVVYDRQKKRDLAVVQYRKVLDMKDYKDSHEQAERFLQSPAQ